MGFPLKTRREIRLSHDDVVGIIREYLERRFADAEFKRASVMFFDRFEICIGNEMGALVVLTTEKEIPR